jgi:hypothetical protein
VLRCAQFQSGSYQMHHDVLGSGAGQTSPLTSILHEKNGDVTLDGE